MKKATWYIGAFTAMVLTSCNNSTDIDFITPTAAQVFQPGDVVEVKAKIFDPDGLLGVRLDAITQTGDTIYHYSVNTSGKSYTIFKDFQVFSPGTYKIDIHTWGGYGGSKTRLITVE